SLFYFILHLLVNYSPCHSSFSSFFCQCYGAHPYLHSFPTRRSSDLTNLLKFMRASIKMIGVSNLQSFIASMTQKLTLSDISDESKNYLDKAGITTACLRIKSKWTAGGK